MDAFLAVFLIVAVALLLLCVLVAWGLVKATRSAQTHARRAKAKVAETLPASAFGRRLWWMSCRVTRVDELGEQAVLVSTSSPLAEEVASLAGDLRSEARAVKLRIRGAARLTGRFRQDEVKRIDVLLTQLESGAESLIELAEKSLSVSPRPSGTEGGTERLIRRTESFKRAIDELRDNPFDEAPARQGEREPPALESPRQGEGWVPPRGKSSVDPDDADSGPRPVPRVQRDEKRGQRLDS